MNYKVATLQQLYTIAYHEPCSRVEKILALMELARRKQNKSWNQSQEHIKRKRG